MDPTALLSSLGEDLSERTGNCSFSPYPVRPGRPAVVERYELRTALAGIEWGWSDLDGYARLVESAGTSVNIAPLVGQASVRIAVIGAGDEQPTPEQLLEMQRLVDQALEQGAFGMSVGLTLVPSGFAGTEELIALVEPLGRHGRLYVQHSRLWAGWHAKTIEEAVQIGRAAGCGVQISHHAHRRQSRVRHRVEPDWHYGAGAHRRRGRDV